VWCDLFTGFTDIIVLLTSSAPGVRGYDSNYTALFISGAA